MSTQKESDGVMTACSSVGRAGDCSTCKISLGHWFDSGRADSFANDTTNAFAIILIGWGYGSVKFTQL